MKSHLPPTGQKPQTARKCNHRNNTIDFTFFSKKGLCNNSLKAKKALPLHTIISNNTFKVTICDLKNKDRNMADNIEHQDKRELVTNCDQLQNDVSAVIHTQQISRQFQLDVDRHNAQYAPIDVETFRLSHDRFLCIDDDVYHIDASIKDLGKKWFGFSKMEILTPNELAERINRV